MKRKIPKNHNHPFEKNILCKLNSLLTLGCFVPIVVEIGPVVRFWKSSIYFHFVTIIYHLERLWPFILLNVPSLNPRMLCATFYSSGSGIEDENVKSLQWRSDKFWSEKPTWAFSSDKLNRVYVYNQYKIKQLLLEHNWAHSMCYSCRQVATITR